jgi:hypothetical protein
MVGNELDIPGSGPAILIAGCPARSDSGTYALDGVRHVPAVAVCSQRPSEPVHDDASIWGGVFHSAGYGVVIARLRLTHGRVLIS